MDFEFRSISTYRTQLMGIATLGVLICHANLIPLDVPNVIKNIFILGNLGVDIFLFVSGLGLSYSLNKIIIDWRGGGVKNWYSRRYVRILLPYVIIILPYWIIETILQHQSLEFFIVNFSTLGFWLHHRGIWFLALLIPLYFISPILSLINKLPQKYALLIWGFLILLSIEIVAIQTTNPVAENIMGCIRRIPSFLMGFAIFPYVKSGRKIKLWIAIIVSIAVFLIEKLCVAYLHTPFSLLPQMILAVVILTSLLSMSKNVKWINSAFIFLGVISLESYLTNFFIVCLYHDYYIPNNGNLLNEGNIVTYSLIVIIGISLAYFVMKASSNIRRINKDN